MALEVGEYITDLQPSDPKGVDPLSDADDHLRLIKKCLQQSFSAINAAVTANPAELNSTIGMTVPIVGAIVPVGGIIMYNGLFANIPTNWQLCDGTNETPDLTDRFVFGTNTEGELLNTGGSANAVVVSHTHTGATLLAGAHAHTIEVKSGGGDTGAGGLQDGIPGASNTSQDPGHTHGVTISTDGVDGTNANLPPYLKLAYIQRMS